MKNLLLLALLFISSFLTAQVTYPLKVISNGSGGTVSGIDSIRFNNSGVLHTPLAAFTKVGNTGVVTQSLLTQTAGTIFGNSSTSTATPTFTTTPVIAGSLGIGSTNQPTLNSILELTSTTRGLLIPRMTITQRNAIAGPPAGLTIYNTTTDTYDYFHGNSGTWRNIASYTRRDNSGITHNDANGIMLENTTPATVGLSQAPPDIVATGLGWGTTLASSQRIGYRLKVDATNGTIPISVITLDSWFNGAYQTEATFTGGSSGRGVSFSGLVTATGTLTAPNISLPFNGTGIVFSAGQGSIFNNAGIFTYNSSVGHLITSAANAFTTGTQNLLNITGTFAPTSGIGVHNGLVINNTINQTGGANGITRGLLINSTLTATADYRALEITGGKIVVPSTIIASGTTGAQTINRISGKVNAASGSTSLVVTNNLVTANSIVWCSMGTNDATARITSVVEAAGSFTINYIAPTAETVIKFVVIN